jgi:alkyldihydroxyacetonephosphate synthase
MRKNRYGNIEDIVVQIKFVTARGTLEKSVAVPRISTGPDIHEIILGSEGILGVVTEVVVKVRPQSEFTMYGSMIFPDFESGVACLHEIGLRRLQPVSIRLVDNRQFQFGQVLKPEVKDWKEKLINKAKKWYVTKHLQFDPDNMVAATLLFEGKKNEVLAHEKVIYNIASKYGGMKAGEENGIRGYFLTYMIAYLRDFGFQYQFIAESFETSVPYENVLVLCQNVKNRITMDCEEAGVVNPPLVSCRVTQLYDTGACVYFYFGFVWTGLKDPLGTFSRIEHNARDEILKMGGSLSHHHGVGKHRSSWLGDAISEPGMIVLEGIKRTLDPTNVFGAGNLIGIAGEGGEKMQPQH